MKQFNQYAKYLISFGDKKTSGIVENRGIDFTHAIGQKTRCTHTGGQKPVIASLRSNPINEGRFGYFAPCLTEYECVPIEIDVDVVI